MTPKKQFDLVRRLEGELSYLCMQAAEEGWTHDKLLERTDQRVWQHPEFSKLPSYRKSHLFSYRGGLLRGFHIYGLLKWRVRLDGELVYDWQVPKNEWHRVQPGAFVWEKSGYIYSDALDNEKEKANEEKVLLA